MPKSGPRLGPGRSGGAKDLESLGLAWPRLAWAERRPVWVDSACQPRAAAAVKFESECPAGPARLHAARWWAESGRYGGQKLFFSGLDVLQVAYVSAMEIC